ncbi:MAG TPA: hypothetical protein VLK82_08205 [Candidatus Tectomicrobia bacterium]|nr:hypothetical protein [Candidatus Tectomicrobia bacterium]
MERAMKITLIVLVCGLLIWATVGWGATRYLYTIHNTLTLTGTSNVSLTGITQDRHLTGTFTDPQQGTWSFHERGRTDTRLPISGMSVTAQGINDRDQVVGHVFRGCENISFRYHGSAVTDYEGVGWDLQTMDLNNDGTEVGTYRPAGDPDYWCYWREHQGPLNPWRWVEGQPCRVHDITEARDMGGSYLSPNGREHGWV